MGINIGPEIKYKCYNDCQENGCPGHTMRMDDSRSIDQLYFVKDGSDEPFICLDENQWKAMKEAEKAHAEKHNWNNKLRQYQIPFA